MAETQASEATPSFGRLCPAMTWPESNSVREADGLDHGGPALDLAFEIAVGIGEALLDRIEARLGQPFQRIRLLHQRIDLGVELRHHRVGRLAWREHRNPRT